MRRLRQDLEKVRLLCELIRKREQRKRDLIVAEKNIMEVKLTPFMYFLKKLLEQLQEIDTSEIFAEPVSLLNVTLIRYMYKLKRFFLFEHELKARRFMF